MARTMQTLSRKIKKKKILKLKQIKKQIEDILQ